MPRGIPKPKLIAQTEVNYRLGLLFNDKFCLSKRFPEMYEVCDQAFGKDRWSVWRAEMDNGDMGYRLKFWHINKWLERVEDFSGPQEIIRLVKRDFIFE